jgi:hypothetical protein
MAFDPRRNFTIATRALALAAALAVASSPVAVAATTCPVTSPPAAWSGSFLDTDTTKDGIEWDTSARLQLADAAGEFSSVNLGVTDFSVFAAVADFDRDGWDDFVGLDEPGNYMRIYKNRTYENPEPDWTDTSQVRTPKFDCPTTYDTDGVLQYHACHVKWPEETNDPSWSVQRRPTVAADFDGDGWPDILSLPGSTDAPPWDTELYINKGENTTDGYPTFNGPYWALASDTSLSNFGSQPWGGTTIQTYDYNGDRKLDVLVSAGSSGGTIRVFLNTCTIDTSATPPPAPAPLRCLNRPTFSYLGILITGLGYGVSGTARHPVFDYADVDGDSLPDLVVGAPTCCADASLRLRLYKGTAGGGLSSTHQSIAFQGGATVVFLRDFSGDGKIDLIVGTDNWNYNAGHGGESFYWVNNGTGTPFSNAPLKLTTHDEATLRDYDVGFPFDYDHDPDRTIDLMIADGNHTGSFFVQANRVAARYVPCGTAASGAVDLGPLASSEMVVTAARIEKPVMNVPNGTSIKFFMSNESPENWVQATPCADDPSDYCASFPKPVGRIVKWKVEMCSNSTNSKTPTLSSIQASFDYTPAREHFRAGAIVHDGVAYLGGFRQPGDRGHLFAINAGLSQTYWDAAAAINSTSDSNRKVYTATTNGTTRLDFTASNASSTALQTTLAVSDATQAATIINWVRSARFGVGNTGIELSRLGAIETSTPAILTKPGFPIWYVHASSADKARHDAFRTANAGRRNLVLFGAKDGMIHAIQTAPSAITTAPSGTEAWAFIPPKVAAGIVADYTTSQSAGVTQVASYPDGSPTLADYRKADGSYATAALVASGNGGKSLIALDVTSTVSSSGTVIGPTPLWTATPGEGDAGQAFVKPAVARVLIDGAETYIAIAATGLAHDNPTAPFTKGRVVSAYDLTNGRLLWKFQAECAVTSDIATFETDDELEAGAPTFNGYVDRAVFADACGYVYKLDPARDLEGAWNDNTGLGAIAVTAATTTTPSGETTTPQRALFSTRLTADALGKDSPIGGTLAIRSDSSTRVVLFFGTGGLESHPATEENEFYAVYADTGELRSKMTGSCSGGQCEKFYGGAVVTPEQVIFTRTIDPAVGTATCDDGSTKLTAAALEAAANDDFAIDFEQTIDSAVMGSLYGDAGALYFATLSGDISRIGSPRAGNAGGDSTGPGVNPFGTGNESTTTGTVGTTDPLTLLGWRQVY